MGTGAQFSRVKVWGKERLLYADLNGEFNNILNNLNAAGVGGSSAALANMQSTTNPAPYVAGVQTESLPTSQDGENQRMRYALSVIGGQANWYNDPGRTLVANPDDLVGHIPFDGNTVLQAYGDTVRRGAIVNANRWSVADFTSSELDATNKAFGNYAWDLGVSNVLALPSLVQETGSLVCQFRNLAAGDYIAYNPLLGIELYLDGSGFLNARVTQSLYSNETSKATSVITGSVSRASSTAFQALALRWTLNNGASLDSLGLLLAAASEGSQLSAQTVPINAGAGGVWLLGAKKTAVTWDHFSAMKVLPSAEAADAWSSSVTAGEPVVSGGLLTITTTAAHTNTYSKTNNINLGGNMTAETKCWMPTTTVASDSAIIMQISDHVATRQFIATMFQGFVTIQDGTSSAVKKIFLDTTVPHIYRMSSVNAGGPNYSFYIDGVCVLTGVLTNANDAGSTFIKFGATPGGSGNVVAKYEWFAYVGSVASLYPPVSGSTQGQLDDIGVIKAVVPNIVATQLVNNSVKTVYGKNCYQGPTLPSDTEMSGSTFVTTSGELSDSVMYVPSDGLSDTVISLTGVVTNATNSDIVDVNVLLDGLSTVQTPLAGVAKGATAVTRVRRRLPAGLHKLSAYLLESGGAGASLSLTGALSVSRG